MSMLIIVVSVDQEWSDSKVIENCENVSEEGINKDP